MKKTSLFVIASILLCGFFVSCSANRGFLSNVTRDDIQQMAQFEMYANFARVENGVSIIDNDSVTNIAKSLFTLELANDKTLPVTEIIVITDSLVHNRVQDEIHWLMRFVENPLTLGVKAKDLMIPPTVDSILCSRNERFGLLVYNAGYSCPDGELRGMNGNILTACEGSTRSAIFIVDSELKNLAYVATAYRNSDPLKAETYQKQVKDLLKKYKK